MVKKKDQEIPKKKMNSDNKKSNAITDIGAHKIWFSMSLFPDNNLMF